MDISVSHCNAFQSRHRPWYCEKFPCSLQTNSPNNACFSSRRWIWNKDLYIRKANAPSTSSKHGTLVYAATCICISQWEAQIASTFCDLRGTFFAALKLFAQLSKFFLFSAQGKFCGFCPFEIGLRAWRWLFWTFWIYTSLRTLVIAFKSRVSPWVLSAQLFWHRYLWVIVRDCKFQLNGLEQLVYFDIYALLFRSSPI